ncbi:autotransporter-associated beta strand repeat-containing protein [Frankia sp. AiPa1]|nr:autotransporter-associated beta strand repeat-containing protein [Frankia sp. AiPa1]
MVVTLDAARGGFHAHDTWRNDIDGRGGLVKAGTGTLALTGANSFSGGTQARAGVLTAGSASALGHGSVRVNGGTLRLEAPQGLRVKGAYSQTGGVLAVRPHQGKDASLQVDGTVRLDGNAVLTILLGGNAQFAPGGSILVLVASSVRGTFGRVTVDVDGLRAVPEYTPRGVSVRLVRG